VILIDVLVGGISSLIAVYNVTIILCSKHLSQQRFHLKVSTAEWVNCCIDSENNYAMNRSLINNAKSRTEIYVNEVIRRLIRWTVWDREIHIAPESAVALWNDPEIVI